MTAQATMDQRPTPATSRKMRAVRRRNTWPELALRAELRRAGIRYRIHANDLPGTPDIVIPGARVAVFVHGCFWHRHLGCRRTTTPRTNTPFWTDKFEANIRRDTRNARVLRAAGWSVLVVWECKIAVNRGAASRRITRRVNRLKAARRRDPRCEALPNRVSKVVRPATRPAANP